MVNKPGGIETALGLASELAQETAQRCNFSPANTDNPVHESPPEKPKPSPRFIKPSVEEIRAYCAERQNHLDAQSFYDFYESKGWMIGKDKEGKGFDPRKLLAPGFAACVDMVKYKIDVFGSTNKA